MTEPMMKTPEDILTVESTTRLIDELEAFVNNMSVYTRRPDLYPFDTVAGELLSKCFALSRSALLLIQSGYSDEAFGLCRSLYESSIYLRYITREPEQRERRATDYLEFGVTSKAFWFDLLMQGDLTSAERTDIEMYKAENAIPDDPKIVTQPWSGRRRFIETFSKMAHPTDSSASTEHFRLKDKAISYTDTSSYVHCTQPGLNSYTFEWREPIRVRRSKPDMGNTAFKTCLMIHTHLRAVVRYCLFGWGLTSADNLKDRNHPAADIFTDGDYVPETNEAQSPDAEQ
ncbi:MAG TPA: DUF5677 domain-containing protein [Terracidiphilus sp.]|nr:DUF5677 domain-containing protein [Terracidiphilus sp.]